MLFILKRMQIQFYNQLWRFILLTSEIEVNPSFDHENNENKISILLPMIIDFLLFYFCLIILLFKPIKWRSSDHALFYFIIFLGVEEEPNPPKLRWQFNTCIKRKASNFL
jgi:hypothetical protein